MNFKQYILLFLLVILAPAFAEQNNVFNFEGHPINPACVALFDSSLSDSPYISAINLNACQNSNAAYQNTMVDKNGNYYFYYNDKNIDEGEYLYQFIGESTNQIIVLRTINNGGGIGDFEDLLFLKLHQINFYTPNKQPFTELRLVGYLVGGDRCSGGFAKVVVQGNQLNITQYTNAKNAIDCSHTKQYTIDLSHFDA